jgi:quinol monooxygenase YgiN
MPTRGCFLLSQPWSISSQLRALARGRGLANLPASFFFFKPTRNSMDPINVIITFEAKPEGASAFAELMHQVKQSLPSADGCRGVQLFGRSDNACVFTLVETWESQSHHQAHIAGAVASGAWDALAAQLACAPVSCYCREL